jgi:hypothetical protein
LEQVQLSFINADTEKALTKGNTLPKVIRESIFPEIAGNFKELDQWHQLLA